MKHPIVKILLVFVSGIVIARVFWFLGFIPNLFRNIINPGNCSGYEVKTIGMYICSAFVAFKMLLGPLLVMLVIFLFRKSIIGFINKMKPKIPNDFQFLLAPLVSTFLFTIVWSGSHPSIMDTEGIIDQRSFPVIVGLFTFITTFYYKEIQKKLVPFFEKRDKFSKPIRYVFAFAIPFFLSLIITFEDRVSNVALKEQIIVIISLITGYLVLLPRSGIFKINLNNK
jgi:hypothetical protein